MDIREGQDISATDYPFVSVLIPMRNEEHHIGRCLNSILANDYPQDRLEVLVIDGVSTDSSREIVDDYSGRHVRIRLLINAKRIQSAAMNIGLSEAKGEIIARMDAHSVYDSDYISQCVHLLQTTDAANVGGLQQAIGTNFFTRAVALATTSQYGIGDAKFRYAKEEMWVDTVYLGVWRKQLLESIGGFDESLPVNEDYELNCRLKKAEGKVLFSPRIKSSYVVRASFARLSRQYSRYGFWKVRTLGMHPDSLRWRQLAPPVFVLGLLGSLAVLPFIWQLGLIIPALYLLYVGLASRKIARKKSYLLIIPVILVTLHLSWGVGFLVGLFRWGIPHWKPKSLVKVVTNGDANLTEG